MPEQVSPDITTPQLERDLVAARRRVYKIARAADVSALNARPRPGEWSPLEIVRHLLFAEQLHFGRLQKGKTQFSPLGMTGMTAKEFAIVGTATTDLGQVLAAWDKVRATNRKALKDRDDEDYRRTIQGNTRHIKAHTARIERLLRP